jgi:hypothetical protein
MNQECTLAYTLQLANQPLLNLFVQTYSGAAGRTKWFNLPSNQLLIQQGNIAEVNARWNLIIEAVDTSLLPPCSASCSTNLRNQLAIHDLLLLSLLPSSLQPNTCAIATATALTATLPVRVSTTNAVTGNRNTVVIPPSSQPSTNIIPGLNANITTTQPVTQANFNAAINKLNTMTMGANGFFGTLSNQALFNQSTL